MTTYAVTSLKFLRGAVCQRMVSEWQLPGEHHKLLQKVLQLEGFPEHMTAEQDHICEMLLGEHGLTIFKMLLAQETLNVNR